MVRVPAARFLALLGMTVQPADADQAYVQRRPDPAGAGAADGSVRMRAHACHSEEQSDEESWAGTKKLLRLSVDQQVWNPLHRSHERSRTSSVPKLVDGFTKKYNVGILVYFEATDDIRAAIAREKQIKAWRRSKRIALIESMNPQWRDLSECWFTSPPPDSSLRSE